MYRIVPVHYPALLFLFPYLALGPALIAGACWVYFAFVIEGQSEWRTRGTEWSLLLSIGFLSASVVGAFCCYDFYRNGRTIIFDERLTIHYPWPCQSRVYAWNDIQDVEAIDEKVAYQQPTVWIPIPVGAIIPGLGSLTLNLSEERWINVRKYRIRDKNFRALSEFVGTPESSLQLGRWFHRYYLHGFVESLGGEIEWQGDAPREIILRGCQFEDGQFACLRERMANIAGIEELDLTGTNLTDADLDGLDAEEIISLKTIRAQESRISPTFLASFNAKLAQRSAKGQFDFA